jgi:hypothetical protein
MSGDNNAIGATESAQAVKKIRVRRLLALQDLGDDLVTAEELKYVSLHSSLCCM